MRKEPTEGEDVTDSRRGAGHQDMTRMGVRYGGTPHAHSSGLQTLGAYHITGHLNCMQATRSDRDLVALYRRTEWMAWGYKRLSSPLIAVYQVTDAQQQQQQQQW